MGHISPQESRPWVINSLLPSSLVLLALLLAAGPGPGCGILDSEALHSCPPPARPVPAPSLKPAAWLCAATCLTPWLLGDADLPPFPSVCLGMEVGEREPLGFP